VLSISAIEEGGTVSARGIAVGISGIDVSLLYDVMTDYQLGGPVAVYFGALDSSGALIPDPVQAWTGRTDKPTLRIDGTTASIEINCETRLIDMNVPIDRRRTSDDQQQSYPGDLGFSFVDGLQECTITMGTMQAGTLVGKNI
jgi:hypothetical protein